jgi:hypothetical protein
MDGFVADYLPPGVVPTYQAVMTDFDKVPTEPWINGSYVTLATNDKSLLPSEGNLSS